ncbi:hypothetical protein [Chitiniphilus shinanonensis]|uniref:hypothetical protein n=1 Tax=Chitiniphilus shinanonensis TaxID=553088 RepID=UPI00037061C4|nr:hypothetical protein [Chitiniphilus shinanonensis]
MHLQIADTVLPAHHAGGAAALCLAGPSGERWTLPPWTYRQHLAALRECVTVDGDGAALDSRRLADAVLATGDLPDTARDAAVALALWWAGGADTAPEAELRDGWIDLDGVPAQLAPWTEGQRAQALGECLVGEDAEGVWFDAVGYLDRMARATLRQPAPDTLHAAATQRLLNAVVALNVVDPEDRTLLGAGPAARETAQRTLRACRALGWTPSQVWAAPAAEIERVLQLLALAETPPASSRPAPAAAPRRPRLADHPDAFVIQFEDDAP